MPVDDEGSFSIFDQGGSSILDEGIVLPTVLIWSGRLIGPCSVI